MQPSFRHGLGAIALTIFVVLLAVAVDSHVAGWAAQLKSPPIDAVVGVLNPIGSGVTLLVACVGLGTLGRALGRSPLREAGWLGALTFVAAGLVEFALKHLVGRPRPDAGLQPLALLGPSFVPDFDSFPSGHATSVFAIATVFASEYPRLAWPLYLLAASIAAGRVYLERHYVSDIVAGAMLGITVASLLLRQRTRLPGWLGASPIDAPR